MKTTNPDNPIRNILKHLARGLALSAALAFVPATHAAVFTNGGFEINTGNGSTPTGWTNDFNSYGAYSGAAHSGSWGLHVGHQSNSGGRYQDFDTVSGTVYLVTAWARNFESAVGTSHMDILIGTVGSATYNFPGANTAHSTTKFAAGVVNNSFLVDDTWSEYTFNFTATATTTRMGIYNSYKTGDTIHSIDVDDVSVTAVPEPSAALLGGLGLLALLRRRRIAVSFRPSSRTTKTRNQ
jgi:MYXO-CTERM domain-containing protein